MKIKSTNYYPTFGNQLEKYSAYHQETKIEVGNKNGKKQYHENRKTAIREKAPFWKVMKFLNMKLL